MSFAVFNVSSGFFYTSDSNHYLLFSLYIELHTRDILFVEMYRVIQTWKVHVCVAAASCRIKKFM